MEQEQLGFALGATDYLIKPVGKARLRETIRQYLSCPPDDHATILLVDDDPGTLALLDEMLRSAGYETQSVRSATRALEVLSSQPVDALLLDLLLMPGMDGFQLIRHLRQQEAWKDLPILVMTAKNLTAGELALLAGETQVLIRKNGSWPQPLLVEVEKAVRNRRRAKSAGR
jgi:CheY-like chemotaxis protein